MVVAFRVFGVLFALSWIVVAFTADPPLWEVALWVLFGVSVAMAPPRRW